MEDLNAILTPGMLVRHPAHPDWGVGQVQSNISGKVTVNFRSEGKIVVDSHRVMRGKHCATSGNCLFIRVIATGDETSP